MRWASLVVLFVLLPGSFVSEVDAGIAEGCGNLDVPVEEDSCGPTLSVKGTGDAGETAGDSSCGSVGIGCLGTIGTGEARNQVAQNGCGSLLPSNGRLFSTETGCRTADKDRVTGAPDCIPHPPIRIEGDEMFRLGPAVGVVNPQAAGTQDDPFVIEGWCIKPVSDTVTVSDMESTAILIRDTSAHVVVRDNWVDGDAVSGVQNVGVELLGADNVTIENNAIVNNFFWGVDVEASHDVVVANNTIQDNRLAGVVLSDSPQGTVVGNTIAPSSLGGVGVALESSDAATIADNEFPRDHWHPILLDSIFLLGSSHATIENNTFAMGGVDIWGFQPADYEHDIPSSNEVDGKPVRYLRGSSDVELEGPAGQVILVNTDKIRIDGLNLTKASVGIQTAYTSNTTITNTTLFANSQGIQMTEASSPRVANNTVHASYLAGITVAQAKAPTVTRNSVTHSGGDGIELIGARQGAVLENQVHESFFGLEIEGGNDIEVRNNTATANFYGAVLSKVGEARLTGNEIVDSDQLGADLHKAHEAEVSNNTIRASGADGVRVRQSQGVRVTDNAIRANQEGVFVWYAGGTLLEANNIENSEEAGLTVRGPEDPVQVQGNWWGHETGPSGGVEDACTGAIADGDGDAIVTEIGEACFDPWLEKPNPEAGAG
jgi:parallel beta-helix repeat protein